MKRKIKSTLFILLAFAQQMFGQITNGTNTWLGLTDYVGWNTTPNGPDLNIKHELDKPLSPLAQVLFLTCAYL
jgi:hypothetical protein